MKKYTMQVTMINDELSFDSTNNGFYPLELAGLFALKLDDILRQIHGEENIEITGKVLDDESAATDDCDVERNEHELR